VFRLKLEEDVFSVGQNNEEMAFSAGLPAPIWKWLRADRDSGGTGAKAECMFARVVDAGLNNGAEQAPMSSVERDMVPRSSSMLSAWCSSCRKKGMPKRNFCTSTCASMLGASRPRRISRGGRGAVRMMARSPSGSLTAASGLGRPNGVALAAELEPSP